jgi:hypothetical protein
MTSPDKTPTPAQAARRQLVRGVFAAPTLLTVFSGSALATGSAKRCLVNKTGSPAQTGIPEKLGTPSMEPVSNSEDSFVRIQLHQSGTAPVKYWVSGATLNNLKRGSTTVYLSSTHWHEFDIVNNKVIGSGVSLGTAPTLSNPAKWAAVRFDYTGSVQGVGISSSQYQSALANTCWNSVAPTL